MDENDWLAARFEEQRAHLRSVAYRMLGSLAEADDAVQNSWLRLSSADAAGVENLGGWLTTVVSRECLRVLRSGRGRREQPLADVMVEPSAGEASDPGAQALLADSVGPALMVVLDTLAPVERLAFVLHDIFAVPFEEIAAILDRSPAAARQLASRPARTTHRRNRLHLQRRQDRRDPRDLRPRTPPPRRPGSARRLTADNPAPVVIAPDKAGHAWRHRRGTGDVREWPEPLFIAERAAEAPALDWRFPGGSSWPGLPGRPARSSRRGH